MRRKTTILCILATAALSLATGIGDLLGKSAILCSSSACMKVHSSSFATAFVIPVGFYATLFLLLSLWFFLKRQEDICSMILCSLLGLELYYTYLQIFFIGSLCRVCLLFLALLLVCVLIARAYRERNAVLLGLMMFLVAHFAFFYPRVTLKPTLTLDEVAEKKAIEIFAAPSCTHCEHAIEYLRKICAKTGTPLIVRPVSISTRDMDQSVRWVTGKLFECKSRTSYRLAEKIVWENEKEARKLNNGKLAVPLILVKVNGTEETFRGWGKDVQRAIDSLFETTRNLGIDTLGLKKSYASTLIESEEGKTLSMCSKGAFCSEDSD
ncbi:MAG: hypothetical protein DRQ02_02995 [Candidatus Latescibacterota bacterium]|nr:MAG: hypothetical protein DRQ02_02995 [Candidatus Latescibacterota bacterium]